MAFFWNSAIYYSSLVVCEELGLLPVNTDAFAGDVLVVASEVCRIGMGDFNDRTLIGGGVGRRLVDALASGWFDVELFFFRLSGRELVVIQIVEKACHGFRLCYTGVTVKELV